MPELLTSVGWYTAVRSGLEGGARMKHILDVALDMTKVERELQRRIAEETRPVQSRYDPSLFEWHGNEDHRLTRGDWYVVVTPDGEVRIAAPAARALIGHRDLAYVEVGIAPAALAIRLSKPGKGLRARLTGKGYARAFQSRSIVDKLRARGWPLPGRFPALWDEASKMLVARRLDDAGH